MLLRRILDIAVPGGVALAAFLHAHAIGSLIDATVPPSSIAPFAEARASVPPSPSSPSKSADAILDRNPFDHVTGPLRTAGAGESGVIEASADDLGDPAAAPTCDGIRAAIAVRADDPVGSFAALDLHGKRVLRRHGVEIDSVRILAISADRIWLSDGGKICQTSVFDPPKPVTSPSPTAPPSQSALEKEIASKIVKTGPNEFQVDRGAVDRILDAQAELMKTPLVPEKDGDRIAGYRLVRVKPGSALAMLGLETGDRLESINGVELTNMERVLEAYARFRAGGVDRLTVHVTRGGKPTNLDYVVR